MIKAKNIQLFYFRRILLLILFAIHFTNWGTAQNTQSTIDATINSYIKQKEYNKAERLIIEEFTSLTELAKENEIEHFMNHADQFYQLNQYRNEQAVYEAIYGYIKNKSQLANYYYRRALNSRYQYRYFESIQYSDSSKNLFLSIQDTTNYMWKNFTTAVTWSDLGFYSKSNALSFEILDYLSKTNPNPVLQSKVYTLLGFNFGQTKQFQKAIYYLKNSIQIIENTNDQRVIYASYLNLGDLYTKLKRYREADIYFNKALAIAQKEHFYADIVLAYRFLAYNAQYASDFNRADSLFSEAIRVSKSAKLDYLIPEIEQTRLFVLVAKGDTQETKRVIHYLDSINVQGFLDWTVNPVIRAEYLIESGEMEKAKAFIDTAFNKTEFALNPFYKVFFDVYLTSKRDVTSAISKSAKLISIFKEARSANLNSPYFKALYAEKPISYLKKLIGSIAESHLDADFLFTMNELIKGQISMTSLSMSNTLAESDSILITRKKLEEQISLEKLKNGGNHTEYSAALQLQLDALEPEQTVTSSQWVSFDYSIEDVQEELPERAAFLHQLETPKGIVFLLIDKQQAKPVFFPFSSAQKQAIEMYNRLVSSPGTLWDFTLSDSLSALILGELQEKIFSYEHLFLSTDGQYSTLPFSSLTYKKSFLAENTNVTHLSSFISAKQLTKNAPVFFDKDALIVCNPKFGKFGEWSPLPFSSLETEAILETGYEASILEGEAASMDNFISNYESTRYRFYHIATHGITEASPDLNRLVFSFDKDEFEGLFFPNQLRENRIPAELVILSSCETATGEYVSGEGIWGMHKSWHIAGAQAVIASLWKINDKSSAEFMRAFYSYLYKNDTLWGKITSYFRSTLQINYKMKAFHEAQKQLIQSRRYTHPYYWAAYQYSGL